MEENNPIGEQIVDYLEEGKLSASENPTLEEWFESNPDKRKDFENYQKIWSAMSGVSLLQKFNSVKAWNEVDAKIESKNSRVRQWKNLALVVSGMAASLFIFIGLTFYANPFSPSGDAVMVATAYGSRSEVVLPDGSRVKLNAGSNLSYHYNKIQRIRQIDFSGEAFFAVSKSKIPFIIQTPDGLNVKVLGTKFNLCTYPEDLTAQTSLFEGRVELSHPGSASLILKPGQIAVFDKKSNQLFYTEGEISHTTSWMQNKLYMENMSLQEVCTRLERWYDVQITLNDKSLGDKIHYTGVLKEQTVLDVLNALCRLSDISYDLRGKSITISKK